MRVDVRVDIANGLKKFDLVEADAKAGIARALNRTATTARAQASREIRAAGYALKAGDVKAAISVRKATQTEFRAVLRAVGRPNSVGEVRRRQTKDGVSVSVKNGRTVIKGAFIATMPSGHTGVFVRVKSDAHSKAIVQKLAKLGRLQLGRVKRHGLPIQQLFGPSIPTAFENDVVQRATSDRYRDRFPGALMQELRYVHMRLNAGAG